MKLLILLLFSARVFADGGATCENTPFPKLKSANKNILKFSKESNTNRFMKLRIICQSPGAEMKLTVSAISPGELNSYRQLQDEKLELAEAYKITKHGPITCKYLNLCIDGDGLGDIYFLTASSYGYELTSMSDSNCYSMVDEQNFDQCSKLKDGRSLYLVMGKRK